jgi:hypothetical protein
MSIGNGGRVLVQCWVTIPFGVVSEMRKVQESRLVLGVRLVHGEDLVSTGEGFDRGTDSGDPVCSVNVIQSKGNCRTSLCSAHHAALSMSRAKPIHQIFLDFSPHR